MEATTKTYKCPICGGDGEQDHNSFQCHACKRLWPLSYLDHAFVYEKTEESMDKETIYGKPSPNPIVQIGKRIWEVVSGLAEGAHTYAGVLGLVMLLIVGLSSMKGVPIYLQAGEGERVELLFSGAMGMLMVGVGLLGLVGMFIGFGKEAVSLIKKRRGKKAKEDEAIK